MDEQLASLPLNQQTFGIIGTLADKNVANSSSLVHNLYNKCGEYTLWFLLHR